MTKTTQEVKDEIRGMLERLCIAYDVSRKELPEIFGVGAKSINNWVHYGRRPYDQIRECHLKTGISIDWLMCGTKNSQPVLVDNSVHNDVDEIMNIINTAFKGAVEYKTIDFRYDDAKVNLLEKLKSDLNQWYEMKSTKPQPNGDNGH